MNRIPLLIFTLTSLMVLPCVAWCTPGEVELTVDAGAQATALPLKIGHCISQHKIGGAWNTDTNDFDDNAGDVVGFAGMRGAGLLRFPNGNEASEGILLSAYCSIKWGLGNASDGA